MPTTLRWLGALLVVLGAALVVRSGLLLSGRGRPRRGPQPAFVVAGPYRRVRNPLFGGIVIAILGTAAWAASGAIALVAIAAAAAAHAWIVLVEEPALTRRFGAAYEAYLRRVPRWWPSRSASDDDEDAARDVR